MSEEESKDEQKKDKNDGVSNQEKSGHFRRKFRNNRVGQAYGNADKYFEGVTSEIGGVLGLSTENYVNKKVNFDKFQELLITYVIKKYSEAATTEISEAIRELKNPVELYVDRKMPKMDTKIESGSIEEMILKEEIREYVRTKNLVMSCVTKLYALIWGQCTDGLQSVLKMDAEYEEKTKSFDGVWLLRTIKKILAGVTNYRNGAILLREKLYRLLSTRQFPDESLNEYLTRFKNNYESLKQVAGENVVIFENLIDMTWPDVCVLTPNEMQVKLKEGRECFLAGCLIMGANDLQFGYLKRSLESAKNLGRDEYPVTLQAAYELLLNTFLAPIV